MGGAEAVSKGTHELHQVVLVGAAQPAERCCCCGTLAVVRDDGAVDRRGATVVQVVVAEARTPLRRGPHAAGDGHRVAVVPDQIATIPSIVDRRTLRCALPVCAPRSARGPHCLPPDNAVKR